MDPSSPRENRSLRDAAKAAAAPNPPPADSSGVVDLGALMAAQPNWLDDALARAKANTAPATFDSMAPMAITPTARGVAHSVFDAMPAGVPKRRIWPFFATAGGVAIAGTLACVLALLAHAHGQAAARVPPKPAPVAAHAEEPTPPADVPPATQDDVAMTYEMDDPAPVTASAAKAPRPPAPVAARALPAAPGKPKSALDSALRAAAGNPAPTPAPPPPPVAVAKTAPPPGDNRPERPSGSAVTSALTQALPAARACVGTAGDPSRASITFSSDGSVQSVNVTGPAAGDPKAAQCLRKAFSGARLPPFSQGTYTAGVTVRPR